METFLEDSGPCRKTIRRDIPANRVREVYEEILTEYVQSAEIPGFRRGRAPREVVERRFQQAIREEAQDKLVRDTLQQAIDQHDLRVVQIISAESGQVMPDEPTTVRITVDTYPEFELPEYKRIPLKRRKPNITEEQVNAALENLRDRLATWEDIGSRPLRQGDLAQIDYEGVAEGGSLAQLVLEVPAVARGEGEWVLVQEESLIPGLGAALVGLSPGQRTSVLVDFPKDYPEKAVAGMRATYFVTVRAGREKRIPELDESRLAELGVKSEAELREKIRQDLQRSFEKLERMRLLNEIMQHLLQHTSFEVPESLLKPAADDALHDILSDFVERGVPEDSVDANEVRRMAERVGKERVRLRLIFDRIAEKENIHVTNEEFAEYLTRLARRLNRSPNALLTELQQQSLIPTVLRNAVREKTLNYLLQEALIEDA